MKKEKIKNLLIKLLIIVTLFILTGCSNKENMNENNISNTKSLEQNEKINIAKEAAILDWNKVSKEIRDNGAKAVDYNEKWFIYTGMVSNIEIDRCFMFTEMYNGYPLDSITVELPIEELKELKNYDVITVVGQFENLSSFNYLRNAFVFPSELLNDESFNIELFAKATKGKPYNYSYIDYKYNENGLVSEYSERYSTFTANRDGSVKNRYDNLDKYSLTYDDNNRIISKNIECFENGVSKHNNTTTFTYNELGLISTETTGDTIYNYTYEKDQTSNRMIGKSNDGLKNGYIYEYNEKGKLVKETGIFGSYTEYIYDEYDRLISKIEYNSKGEESRCEVYYYAVIGKK